MDFYNIAGLDCPETAMIEWLEANCRGLVQQMRAGTRVMAMAMAMVKGS